MALSPKFTGCFRNNCKTIRLTDITGVYDSTTNVGGWGTPNTTLAQADPVTIALTLTNGTTSTFTVTSTVNSAVISGGEFHLIDINTTNITGFTDSQFSDGIYDIVYSVTDSSTNTIYTHTLKIWNDCRVRCCINKMLSNFCQKLCGCDGIDYINNHTLAEAMLYAAKCKFGEGKYDEAESILADVEKICKITRCQC